MCVCSVSQLCLTLCNPMDCSPPVFSVYGIFQVRILEWVAISSPGDLPDPEIKSVTPTWQMDSFPLSHQGSQDNSHMQIYFHSFGFRSQGKVVTSILFFPHFFTVQHEVSFRWIPLWAFPSLIRESYTPFSASTIPCGTSGYPGVWPADTPPRYP